MAKTAARKKYKEPKILTFAWTGKDKAGNKSKGTVDALSLSEAKIQLRKQGINYDKVKKQSVSIFSNKDKPIKPIDIAFFTRQMATMMRSGVPLLQGLDIVGQGAEKAKLKKLIYDIRADVNGGSDLSTALSRFPQYFDDLYVSLVAAGEQSGSLEAMLDRLALYKEKSEALKAKIKKALTYPTAVVVVGLLVTAILLVKVVPVFEDVFGSFGADLPAFTKFVVNLSEIAQSYWLYVLVLLFIGGYFFRRGMIHSKKFRDSVERASLKIPVIGGILYNAAVARFARTLATTFSAGVPLVQALESCAGAAGNVVFHDAIMQIRNGIAAGQSLKNAINMTGVFPVMTVQMVAIGEEAGSLDTMLDKVAEFFEASVDNSVDNLSSLLEPLIMVVLGTLVGGLVIAMYLPIFQLGQVVGG